MTRVLWAAQAVPGLWVRPRPGKYWAFAVISFKQRRHEVAALLGRVGFYALLLLIFSALWQTAFAAEAAAGLPAQNWRDYVWYLVVTEWIMLSQPSIHLDVESDIRNGDIAYQLGRPISYAGSKLAAGAGDLAVRLVVLGASGLVLGRIFSGTWPSWGGLLGAALVGVLASGLMLMCLLAIGLCSFWLHDCMPVYLIWQKLMFVLGGLLLPLTLYPDWLQALAKASPFAAMLYGPGQLVMTGSLGMAVELALEVLGWMLPVALGLVWLERVGRRRLEMEGG